jgi:tetratricopeptide (TPR) repeat protein
VRSVLVLSSVTALALSALALGATIARAQDAEDVPPDARARLAQGEALFEAENFLAALAEFQSAYDLLDDNPQRFLLLYNIGQSHERLFHYDEALTYYQRYLDEGGAEAEGAADVRASMRALEGLLGTLVITADVASATVWIDGHEAGTAPGSVHVPGGRHDVELRAEGRLPSVQEVQVAARDTVELSFTLPVLQDYDGVEPTAFWLVASSAAAILVAGAGVGIGALLESGDGYRAGAATPPTTTTADQRYVADLALAADIVFLVGAAAVIGAVVLAALTDWDGPRRDESIRAVRAMPIVAPSLAGLTLSVDL